MEEQETTEVILHVKPDLHKQLKAKSALEGEALPSIAKRAIDFYLAHGDAVVDAMQGANHLPIAMTPSISSTKPVEAVLSTVISENEAVIPASEIVDPLARPLFSKPNDTYSDDDFSTKLSELDAIDMRIRESHAVIHQIREDTNQSLKDLESMIGEL